MKKYHKILLVGFFTFVFFWISSCTKKNEYILIGYEKNISSEVLSPYNLFGTRIKAKVASSESQEIEVSYGLKFNFENPFVVGKHMNPNQEIRFELYRRAELYTKNDDYIDKMIYTFNNTLQHFFDDFYIEDNLPFVDTITIDDLLIDNENTYLSYYYKLTPINDENIAFLYERTLNDGTIEVYSPLNNSTSAPSEFFSFDNVRIKYEILDNKITFFPNKVYDL